MLVHAFTPTEQAALPQPATYGALFDRACQSVQEAIVQSGTGSNSPAAAHSELVGYRHFLRTCGAHLALLRRLQPHATDDQRRLAQRLVALPADGAGPSAWLRASQTLGAAHDLLATHLGRGQVPLTPEAREILTPTAVLAPTRDLTALLVDAVLAGPDLIRSAADAQRRTQPKPVPESLLKALRGSTASLRPLAKAALLDASSHVTQRSAELSNLEPALLALAGPAPRAFDSDLVALRVLRQLTFTQARDAIDASPTSLRDLAHLGSAIAAQELDWLPEPKTGLERIARAQALDAMEQAQASWSRAAEQLTSTIVGTTRAPRLYSDAVTHLRTSENHSAGYRLACLAALSRLAGDAADTVQCLLSKNALVARTRDPGQLRMVWRPISSTEAADLAGQFREAGVTSHTAYIVVRRQTVRQGSSQQRSVPRAEARREIELTRRRSR